MDILKTQQALEKTRDQAGRKLADLRAEIAALCEELYWLEHAPLCLEDAQRQIDDFFKKQLEENTGIEHFFYKNGLSSPPLFDVEINLGHQGVRAVEGAVIGVAHGDISRAIIPFFGEDARRKLYDLAAAAAKNIESGPPLAERSGLRADVLKRKRAIEVEEETLICSLEELGIDGFYRRADCDPEVVLLLED